MSTDPDLLSIISAVLADGDMCLKRVALAGQLLQ